MMSIESEVRRLHAEGYSIKQMAALASMNRSTVIRWMNKLGLKGNGRADLYTQEEMATVERLRAENVPLKEIAARIGRSFESLRTQVYRRANAVRPAKRLVKVTTKAEPQPAVVMGDEDYVAACLKQGGFVRMEQIGGRTVWVTPTQAGLLWTTASKRNERRTGSLASGRNRADKGADGQSAPTLRPPLHQRPVEEAR